MKLLSKIALFLALFLCFEKTNAQNLPPNLFCVRNDGANNIVLNWNTPTAFCGIFIRYEIYASIGSKAGPYNLVLSVLTVGTTTTALNIANSDSVFVFMKTVQNCGGVVSSISSDTADNSKERPPFVPFEVVTSVNIGNFLKWTPSTFPEVTGYLIFSSSNNFSTPIATVNDRATDNYLDLSAKPDSGFTVYKLRALVACDTLQGALSVEPHNTMFLRNLSSNRCENTYKFRWIKYNNYAEGVKEYQVLVKKGLAATFTLDSILPASDSTYNLIVNEDSINVCVKIIAILNGGLEKSATNEVCFLSDVLPKPEKAFIQRVSVENDNSITLEYGIDTIAKYKLVEVNRATKIIDLRRIGATDITSTILPTPPTEYLVFKDINNPLPQKESYYYQFNTFDSCDREFLTGTARSILLEFDEKTLNSGTFNWNPFEIKNGKVISYDFNKYIDTTIIQSTNITLTTINSFNVSQIFDPNVDTVQNICYKVIANYRLITPTNDTLFLSSSSNRVCMTPTPKAFVPNAFNPVGATVIGANSYLRPNLVFAKKSAPFEFLVFNRYGERVFESNQPIEFWNGVYQGVPAPMDTYIWHLKFTGIDGIEYIRKGVSTLIR